MKLIRKYRFFLLLFVITAGALYATGPYMDNDDGTIIDTSTNLRWQKCSMGQNSNSVCSGVATTVTWQGALQYCNNLSLASKTWRLPSINELKSLIDDTKYSPSINSTYFLASIASYYWSSTTITSNNAYAWNVEFLSGGVFSRSKTLSNYVRCVAIEP